MRVNWCINQEMIIMQLINIIKINWPQVNFISEINDSCEGSRLKKTLRVSRIKDARKIFSPFFSPPFSY
jgi:hypothetical protein